jgi:hypothetical protein
LCKEQQNSKTRDFFRDYGVAKAPPDFKPVGLTVCIYFFPSFCSFCLLIWCFRVSFCTHEGSLPYRSLAQMSCWGEVGTATLAKELDDSVLLLLCSAASSSTNGDNCSTVLQWQRHL